MQLCILFHRIQYICDVIRAKTKVVSFLGLECYSCDGTVV
jgi:hypothetical protein